MYWVSLAVTVAAFFAVQRWIARWRRRRVPVSDLSSVSPQWLNEHVYSHDGRDHR
jgi:hypothetical protein